MLVPDPRHMILRDNRLRHASSSEGGADCVIDIAILSPMSGSWSTRASEWHHEPHGESLGGLRRDGTNALLANESLYAEEFGFVDVRYVPIGDLECLPRDDLVGDRPANQPVMRVDPRQPVGEALLNQREAIAQDRVGHSVRHGA